jgi:hypothetical protein
MTVENHGSRFEGIPDRNLQENRPRSPNFRQIQSQQFQKFLLPVNRFGIFHGRPNIHYQRMSVSVVARPGFEPTAFLVRMIASPAARNFPYDMATETTIAVLRA